MKNAHCVSQLFFFFNLHFIYLSELGLRCSAWASLVSVHGL